MSTLSEHDSKELLAAYGLTVLPERLVPNADDAVAAAHDLGMPVVLKLCGAAIAHKTERGLVRLGLRDDDEIRLAAEELLGAATADDGQFALLVAPQVRGSRELIVGFHRDQQFGPCVMIGVGGVLAEVLGDVAFRLVPIQRVDAEEMLDDLAAAAMLGPFRGEPPVDRVSLVELLIGLSRLGGDRPDIVSVDVNPLIVVDGAPIAVDALVEVKP
jgi:acetate---CoA ligase (ADP-forming) subunit beta